MELNLLLVLPVPHIPALKYKWKETVTIIEQKQIADGIFSLWLQTENIGKEAVPGQFVNLYSKDKSRLILT